MKHATTLTIHLTILLLGILGCDKLQVGDQQGASEFLGLSAIVAVPGGYQIEWTPASGETSGLYDVTRISLSDEESAVLKQNALSKEALGTTRMVYVLDRQSLSLSHVNRSHSLGNTRKNSHLISEDSIDKLQSYAFLINTNRTDGSTLSGRNILLFTLPEAGQRASQWNGCSDVKAIGPTMAQVSFDYHADMSKVLVYRNGVPVARSTDPLVRTLDIDGLMAGTMYEISCEAHFIDGATSTGLTRDVVTPDPAKLLEKEGFLGCIKATPQSASVIAIELEFPKGASRVTLYRDGIQIYSTLSSTGANPLDTGLTEGKLYRYNCEAEIGGSTARGSRVLEATTMVANAPTFESVASVSALGSSSVKITWPPSSGVTTTKFVIYGTAGESLSFVPSAVLKEVSAGQLETVISNLGDELTYTFGVRACHVDLCDGNTITKSATLTDGGAPKTPGVTSAVVSDGKVLVTFPWTHKDGAVLRRRLYQSTTPPTSAATMGDPIRTFFSSNLSQPTTSALVDGLDEHTDYYYAVVDEDPSGNRNDATFVSVKVRTGDLQAPTFGGITDLVLAPGISGERNLLASFTAIAAQPDDSNGAASYRILLKQGGGDACGNGTINQEFAASSYTSGATVQKTISNLTPRTKYAVCIKAVDLAGNVSKNFNFVELSTTDLTPPAFDGIQVALYSSISAMVEIGWNASPTADVATYKVEIWKNSVIKPGGTVPAYLPHAANSSGLSFTPASKGLVGNDDIYFLVNACDDYDNCTTISTPLKYKLPDITPPADFVGIKGSADQQFPAQGQITVHWHAPVDWSDYMGFRIFNVGSDNSLTLLKDCPCTAYGCPQQPTSCTLTGLDAFRTYKLHVRAYDQANNVTVLSVATKSTTVRTTDTQAPVFSPALISEFDNSDTPTLRLSWGQATDNQYKLEPGAVITYRLYRRENADFTNKFNPGADSNATVVSTLAQSYADQSLASGRTYYYAVCARDGAGNERCDGSSHLFTSPDVIKPSIANLKSNKLKANGESIHSLKSWNISWSMLDDATPLASLKVELYSVESSSATPPASLSGYTKIEIDDIGVQLASNLTASANQNTYVHYYLRVSDSAGNSRTAKLSVYSKNAITITSLSRPIGNATGGKLVIIKGDGFSSGMTVYLGGVPCTKSYYFNDTTAGCLTPPGSSGAADMIISAGSSSASLSSAYTYCTGISCTDICDRPSDWGVNFAEGTGLSGAPYKVCSASQLRNTNSVATTYFLLGDNINLDPASPNAFAPIASFYGFLNGNGFSIANFKYSGGAGEHVALYKDMNTSTINDLGIYGFDVSGDAKLGGFLAGMNTGILSLTNIKAGGITVNATYSTAGEPVGGIFGSSRFVVAEGISADNIVVTSAGTLSNTGGLWGSNSGRFQINNVEVTNTTVSAAGPGVGGIIGNALYSGSAGGTDIRMTNASFSGEVISTGAGIQSVGGLAGLFGPVGQTSTNLRFTGRVSAATNQANAGVAAIFGRHGAQVESGIYVINGFTLEDVTIEAPLATAVGGVIGTSTGTNFRNPLVGNGSIRNMNVEGYDSVGGVFGNVELINIRDIRATGLKISGRNNVGGFAGRIARAYSSSDLVVNNSQIDGNNRVGGLFGFADMISSPQRLGFQGKVSGAQEVGGLMGYLNANSSGDSYFVTDAYARGEVNGTTWVGGLVGYTNNGNHQLIRTYTSVKFNGTAGINFNGRLSTSYCPFAVGLVGTVTMADNFFNKELEGSSVLPSCFDGLVAGKTSAELGDEATFMNWDFTPNTGVWKMPVSGGMPIFRWEVE